MSAKRYEIWQTDYELHIPSPEVLSGSAHLSEPTWTEPRRPNYLIFQTDHDGNRTLFTTFLESDSSPGTTFFRNALISSLTHLDSQTLLNLESSELANLLLNQPVFLMESVGDLPETQDLILNRLADAVSFWRRVQWEATCQNMQSVQLSEDGANVWEDLQAMVHLRADDPKTPVEALEWMMKEKTISMTLLTPDIGPQYSIDPQAGNGPNRASYFPTSFDWQLAEGSYVKNSPLTLMLTSQNGEFSLHFYEGSNLVLLRTEARDKWFAAMPKDDPDDVFYQDVFQFMRVWYDEAEHAGLTANIRVPDVGQSQEAVAKAWADAYEGAMMDATPGSIFACTYVRNEEISFPDWLDELSPEELDSFYPADTKGHERFAFRYKTVFVPENDNALHNLMAGNTGGYTGEDAPEGAMEYTHCGYMYLTEEGWRCDGVGTGW